MLSSLVTMVEREEYMYQKAHPEYVPKPKMTHEQFLDDPFGKKKFEREEFERKQRTELKTKELK